MTAEQWLMAGSIVALLASLGCVLFTEYLLKDVKKMLEEVRLCNDDFAQAAELFKQDRHDESIEVLRHWQKRWKIA